MAAGVFDSSRLARRGGIPAPPRRRAIPVIKLAMKLMF